MQQSNDNQALPRVCFTDQENLGSDYDNLAVRVLRAMKLREDSYVPAKAKIVVCGIESTLNCGTYRISTQEAAAANARDDNEAYLIFMLMIGCWNDIQDWAKVRGFTWEESI